MDLTVGLLMILVVGCFVDTTGASYSTEVETFFTSFSSMYKIERCITQAKNKMNMFQNKSEDQKYAIAMINLYTQECKGSFTNSFYSALNKEMREGATGLWKNAGDLMNRAIDILGEVYFKVVYRGCSHNVGELDDPYMFNMITSTSTEPQAAANFASKHGCGTLFIIDNVKGTSVSKYSHFPEDEVLLKSTNRYDVSKDIRPGPEMQTITNQLEITTSVRRIIRLDMSAVDSGVESTPSILYTIGNIIVIVLVSALFWLH